MRIISLFLILSFVAIKSTSASNVDSLLIVLDEVTKYNDDDRLFQTHFELGETYYSRFEEKYEKATLHFSTALEIAKEKNDSEKIISCLLNLGKSEKKRNNYQQALVYFNEILEFEDTDENKKDKAGAYSLKSTIFKSLGDYEKAYESQMQALLIYEVIGYELGIANSLYNIGSIFYYQNNFTQALDYYQRAKLICDKSKNEQSIYSCLAALGSVHEKLGNINQSLSFNKQSLQLATKLNYQTGIGYAKGNIGVNYMNQDEFDKAEKYIKESILIKLKLGDKFGAIGGQVDLSKLYTTWNKPNKAVPVLEDALELALKVESKTRQTDIYKSLAEVYDQINNTNKAYFYTKQYVALKDSLLNDKTLEEMGQSQRRFELQIQENEIEILKKENELLGVNERMRKLQFYFFSFMCIAFLAFIFWIRSRLKYQRKTNKLLESKNEEIQVQNIELKYAQDELLKTNILLEDNNLLLEEKNELLNGKNEEIAIKNKQLEYSNQDLQQFAYVASHDLKEPLRMINSYTTLLKKRYYDLYDDSGKEFLFFVTDAVTRMSTLLDDLLDFSRAGSQERPSKPVPLENVMVLVEANLRHRFESLNAKVIVKNKNLPGIKAHQTQLVQLLQNLVSNGVKFKDPNRDPIVTVDAMRKDNDYVVSVQDNGIGISEENKNKVFEMFKRLHTRDEYEGTGIGLATCKRIVTTWGGDIWLESEVGEGTTFFFSVPISATILSKEKQIEETMYN